MDEENRRAAPYFAEIVVDRLDRFIIMTLLCFIALKQCDDDGSLPSFGPPSQQEFQSVVPLGHGQMRDASDADDEPETHSCLSDAPFALKHRHRPEETGGSSILETSSDDDLDALEKHDEMDQCYDPGEPNESAFT